MLSKEMLITRSASVKDALKKLDKTANKALLVVGRGNKLLGTITDGDIRRYILKGKSLDDAIKDVYNQKSIFIRKKDFSLEFARKILLERRIELIPIVDAKGKVIDFVTWDKIFSKEDPEKYINSKVNVPVVIMAGGKGLRLDPFTRILPKPLMPIGDKTIVEKIIDGFKAQGVKKYFLTLNSRGEMVEAYFNSIDKNYEIGFIKEGKEFLGTAGSLKLLEHEIKGTFIVSNCDVIVKANFEEVIDFHLKNKASLTILASIQHYKIPYGIIKFREGGNVFGIDEKPEYTFPINTGVYILDKGALHFIPDKAYFDMTDLINSLIKNSKKVLMYPVNENDYIDIGQWEEYKKATEKLQLFK